jgi:lipopolysaccharide biosynthesis glycosyltransferase
MARCCVVYTSDEAYLFPTLVSAIEARRFASPAKADVLICHFGISWQAETVFAGICAQEGIQLLAVAPHAIEGASPMLARLFLDRFLPARYAQILYVDGDTRITRPLDPLIEADVPDGRFLAANDPMTFMLGDADAQSRKLAAHLRSIGLGQHAADGYFNTGVLRIARAGWDGIGAHAWQLIRRRGAAFRFPDQDPLNVAAGDSRMPMSLAWNFPIFMRNARVEAAIRPCIYHFMSRPKPWQGRFAPWDADACVAYVDIARTYPELAAYNPALPAAQHARYIVQQLGKKVLESWSWGRSHRRDRILRHEAAMPPLARMRDRQDAAMSLD